MQFMSNLNSSFQELCLNIIPTFASLIEYSQMKSALVPRIKKLCLGTTTLSVSTSALKECTCTQNKKLCLGTTTLNVSTSALKECTCTQNQKVVAGYNQT